MHRRTSSLSSHQASAGITANEVAVRFMIFYPPRASLYPNSARKKASRGCPAASDPSGRASPREHNHSGGISPASAESLQRFWSRCRNSRGFLSHVQVYVTLRDHARVICKIDRPASNRQRCRVATAPWAPSVPSGSSRVACAAVYPARSDRDGANAMHR